jgi:hypothetical protein
MPAAFFRRARRNVRGSRDPSVQLGLESAVELADNAGPDRTDAARFAPGGTPRHVRAGSAY